MAIQYITCVWRAHCTDISVQYLPSLTNSPRKIWGVSKARLWAYGITEEKPYQNKKCIIRKGVIYRKKTNRNVPSKNVE